MVGRDEPTGAFPRLQDTPAEPSKSGYIISKRSNSESMANWRVVRGLPPLSSKYVFMSNGPTPLPKRIAIGSATLELAGQTRMSLKIREALRCRRRPDHVAKGWYAALARRRLRLHIKFTGDDLCPRCAPSESRLLVCPSATPHGGQNRTFECEEANSLS